MFGFGHHNSSTGDKFTIARTIKVTRDASNAPAVSLDKVESHGGISLRKQSEAVRVSLSKKGLAGIRAQVVLVLDHSYSMMSDYQEGKVQDLVNRFLAFGLQVDGDGTVPVIPFDNQAKSAVDVTLDNYKDVVNNKIYRPNSMGSTNLASALEEVRKIANKTDDPLFVAIVTDGEPNDRSTTTEIVCDLARYPAFLKFLAVRPVSYLQQLDDLDNTKRLLDNVDAKSYTNLNSVDDTQFANDMVDEWDSWLSAAKSANILTD